MITITDKATPGCRVVRAEDTYYSVSVRITPFTVIIYQYAPEISFDEDGPCVSEGETFLYDDYSVEAGPTTNGGTGYDVWSFAQQDRVFSGSKDGVLRFLLDDLRDLDENYDEDEYRDRIKGAWEPGGELKIGVQCAMPEPDAIPTYAELNHNLIGR